MAKKKEKHLAPWLPTLTLDEGARVLGISSLEFSRWVERVLNPSEDLRYKWFSKTNPRGLPDYALYAYLASQMPGFVLPERPKSPEVPTTAEDKERLRRQKPPRRKKAATGRETRNNTAR